MTKKTTALIFGHSHGWALRRALESGGYSHPDQDIEIKVILCGTLKFPATLLVKPTRGTESINPALLSALADYPAKLVSTSQEVWLISAVQGNYYNIVGMLDEGSPFDFVLPGREDLPFDTSGQIVPYGAVLEALAVQTFELEPFYKRLTRLGYTGIIHLGAPPPHPDSNKMLSQLAADPKLAGKSLNVSARWTRLKLWLAQEKLLADICKETKVKYLPAPSCAGDLDGYLKSDLCQDAVHGTAEYASMMLNEITKFLLRASQGK